MDQIFNTISHPSFQGILYNLAIVAFVLSLGAIAVGLFFYGRGREIAREQKDENWVLLFASWRDSLIITVIFAAESFAYDAAAFQGLSQLLPNTVLFYAPLAQPLISTTVHVLIFVIASLRIITISRWLRAKSHT